MNRLFWGLLFLGSILLLSARNSYFYSDPRFGPVDAQSILENGTIYLNEYVEEGRIPGVDTLYHLIRLPDGRIINKYPDGVSLIQIPFVAIAHYVLGMDMTRYRHNKYYQKVMAVLIFALLFYLFYLIGLRILKDERISSIVAFLFVWGTSIVGANTAALWSHLFSILYMTVVLYMLIKWRSGESISGVWLGVFLFLTFFSRPTGAIFILFVFGYLFFRSRKLLVKAALTSFILFIFLIGYYLLMYHRPLEPYYSSSLRFIPYGMVSLYCMLLTPTRGLFVFNPVLLFTFAALFVSARSRVNGLVRWLLYYSITFVLFIAFFWKIWWGGWSYGPRLLVEILPALYVVTLYLLGKFMESRFWWRTFLLLSILGFFINSVNGLFNPYNMGEWHSIISKSSFEEAFYCGWNANQLMASPVFNKILEKKVEELEEEAGDDH